MKKLFARKNKILIFTLALAMAGTIFFLVQMAGQEESKSINPPIADSAKNALAEKRKLYGFPVEVFEDLPKPPKDFEKLLGTGYTNLSFFPENFYLQPEFYPGFEKNAFGAWLFPNPAAHAVNGYSFYPQVQEITLKKSEKKTTVFFVRSAWGISTFQGGKIVQENQIKGLSAHIPKAEFLLGPTFPKFSKNWAKKIGIIITASENLAPGDYELVFTAANPAEKAKQNWALLAGKNYYDIGFGGIYLKTKITVKVR